MTVLAVYEVASFWLLPCLYINKIIAPGKWSSFFLFSCSCWE